MALSDKERAMMDAYFEKQGLAPLWSNIKKLIYSEGGGGGGGIDPEVLEQITSAISNLQTTTENLQTVVSGIEVATHDDLDDLIP